jgi:excisionase family DNA binding protein
VSGITIEIGGLEEVVTGIVDERLREHDDGFLDVRAAAAYLCTTAKAVYTMVERGKLPHHRAGGRLLFDRRELRAWVETEG